MPLVAICCLIFFFFGYRLDGICLVLHFSELNLSLIFGTFVFKVDVLATADILTAYLLVKVFVRLVGLRDAMRFRVLLIIIKQEFPSAVLLVRIIWTRERELLIALLVIRNQFVI